jgi:diguanylate cyclase (GGDEF)-like protein/PAS domain S-box-containing protein
MQKGLVMKKVLIVDNHPVFRKFLSNRIRERGHEIFTAKDGLSALEILKIFTPDIMFVDLVMPNIDGYKLCKTVRSRKELDKCFIIVLSAIIAEEKDVSLENLCADLILTKGPFDRLAGQVNHIMDHIESGDLNRLREEIIGGKNLPARQISKELIASNRHLETTINNFYDGLLELTQSAKVIRVNPAAISIIGKSEESLLSSDFFKLFKDEAQTRIRQKMSQSDRIWQEPLLDETFEINNKLVSVKIISFSEQEREYRYVAILKDVTLQKQTECNLLIEKEKYRQEKNFLDKIFRTSVDAIAIVDEHGRFTRWNNNSARMFGYNFAELKGKKAFQLYADHEAMENMLDLLRKQGYVQSYKIDYVCKDGVPLPCSVSISLLYNTGQEKIGSLSIIRDLTEWNQLEERLKYLSFHDSMTGLYNRNFFEEELGRLSKIRNISLGVIVCDIDNLKRINDTMGHQKGDELIKKAARILKKSFRPEDIIARIGGDEFAVLVTQGKKKMIVDCIQRIKKAMNESNYESAVGNSMVPKVSMSVGYAISSEHPLDIRELFKKADDLMYMEKAKRF